MGSEDEALTGFSWRSGSDRETTGILMWSRPFIATIPQTGEEVARAHVYGVVMMFVGKRPRCGWDESVQVL